MWFADRSGSHRSLCLLASILSLVIVLAMATTKALPVHIALILFYTAFPIQAGSLPDAAIVGGVKEGG